jgi:hypothetical protein
MAATEDELKEYTEHLKTAMDNLNFTAHGRIRVGKQKHITVASARELVRKGADQLYQDSDTAHPNRPLPQFDDEQNKQLNNQTQHLISNKKRQQAFGPKKSRAGATGPEPEVETFEKGKARKKVTAGKVFGFIMKFLTDPLNAGDALRSMTAKAGSHIAIKWNQDQMQIRSLDGHDLNRNDAKNMVASYTKHYENGNKKIPPPDVAGFSLPESMKICDEFMKKGIPPNIKDEPGPDGKKYSQRIFSAADEKKYKSLGVKKGETLGEWVEKRKSEMKVFHPAYDANANLASATMRQPAGSSSSAVAATPTSTSNKTAALKTNASTPALTN